MITTSPKSELAIKISVFRLNTWQKNDWSFQYLWLNPIRDLCNLKNDNKWKYLYYNCQNKRNEFSHIKFFIFIFSVVWSHRCVYLWISPHSRHPGWTALSGLHFQVEIYSLIVIEILINSFPKSRFVSNYLRSIITGIY